MTDPAVAKLQALVRIPTISDRDPTRVDADAFDRLLVELRTQFPLLHERLELTRVGRHGLLFRWAGRRADRPLVLMAHLDVVPVDESAPWQHPPFAADLVDGAIWGRGTLEGLRRRDLRGRRAAASCRTPAHTGRLAVLGLRRGGLRYGGSGGRRRAGTA